MVGQQLNLYIAAGVKESIREDFRMPVEHAIKKPIEDLKYAPSEARRMLERVEYSNKYDSYRYIALLVAAGFVLGIGVSYLLGSPAQGHERTDEPAHSRCRACHAHPDDALSSGRGREEEWAALAG